MMDAGYRGLNFLLYEDSYNLRESILDPDMTSFWFSLNGTRSSEYVLSLSK